MLDIKDAGSAVACGRCSKEIQSPKDQCSPTAVLGDYEIISSHVRRSNETDFLAEQISLHRQVIVKIVHPNLSGNQHFIDSFIDVSRKMSTFSHPNLCAVHAIGREENLLYVARENGEGTTLKERLFDEGILDWRAATEIVCDVAAALEYAWKKSGIIHMNLKPDYIVVGKDNWAKVADIGLAGLDPDPNSERIVGTPQYISPERVVGIDGDHRSDLYSLGITFYFMMTGEFPFSARSTEDIISKHLQELPRPASQLNPDIPPKICAVLDMLLEKNPNLRYQLGQQVISDLRAIVRGDMPEHAMAGAGSISSISLEPPGMFTSTDSCTIKPGTLKVRVAEEKPPELPKREIKKAIPVQDRDVKHETSSLPALNVTDTAGPAENLDITASQRLRVNRPWEDEFQLESLLDEFSEESPEMSLEIEAAEGTDINSMFISPPDDFSIEEIDGDMTEEVSRKAKPAGRKSKLGQKTARFKLRRPNRH
jgi:serine/threonine protein kinase